MRNVLRLCVVTAVLALAAPSAFAHTETLAHGTSRDLSQFAGDPTVDGIDDIQSLAAPECGGRTKLRHLNGSARAFPPTYNYALMNLQEAVAQSYAATSDFCPSDQGDGDDLFYIKTGNDRFYKFRSIANGGAGITVEYDFLGDSLPDPPVSSFTFQTYDLWVQFTDTSTGDPSAWSWDFDDSGTSTQQHPRHRYASAGGRTPCLVASNVGGDGAPACNALSVSEVPSVVVPQNGRLDMDGNGTDDLEVLSAAGACGAIVNKLRPIAGAAFKTVSKDYRDVVLADAAGDGYSTSDFCVSVDYLDPFILRTGDGALFKAWTAGNDAGGIRLEFALLGASPIFADGFEGP